MKFLCTFFLIVLLACTPPKEKTLVSIIPLPNQMEVRGSFGIGTQLSIHFNASELKTISENFISDLQDKVKIVQSENNQADIRLNLVAGNKELESYKLISSKKGIEITATSKTGIFYGLQSLKQLFLFAKTENTKIVLPAVEINDEPRFAWRGLMLDESRHFFGIEKVKQIIDLMALHKLNVFHWHLTDAPGWRIEIKQYPKLTTVGGIGNDMDANAPAKFYTQEEIKELVQYASDRCIEIIPEIDMPGHARAANRAYPEFSGGGSKTHPDFTFNPGYDETYTYLTNILKEVSSLFPSKYIHLGGDEVHFGNANWNHDSHVQQLMKEHQLKDLKEMEAYFVHRMADSIKMLNKTVIGWDEIVDHNLPNSNSLVMWWRHDKPEKLKAALSGNYNVVMCPRIPMYFDFVQHDSHEWGRRWKGAFSTLDLTYNFPPDTLPGFADKLNFVKGIQCCVWTERIQNSKRMDFMLHPRLSAMAEAAWTKKANKNPADFIERLKPMLRFFDEKGIYYFNPLHPELSPEPVGVDKKKQ